MSMSLPVSYPVKYYSNTDDGAPQIASVDGSIKAILKACLVTGYGTKSSAGWTALFENATKIVLRFPQNEALLLPDLKIENGAGSYRIISQNNPSSIDDTAQITEVSLLARETNLGTNWDLVACDRGFILYYNIGENGYAAVGHNYSTFLFCGFVKKILDSQPDALLVTENNASKTTGTKGPWRYGGIYTEGVYKNLLTGASMPVCSALNVGSVAGVDFFHSLVCSYYIFPCFVNVSTSMNYTEATISQGGRTVLRVVDNMYQDYGRRNYYLPLDYWEV